LNVLGLSLAGVVVPLVAFSTGPSAGLSAALGLSSLGLSSSEKFFFNHLDGKHMADNEVVGEGEGRFEGVLGGF
jgi:hypothetical protein